MNCLIIIVLGLSLDCRAGEPVSQNPPISIPLTKVKPVKNKIKRPTQVILDARPFFEYTLNHGETSQPIRWEDYSQTEDPYKSMLEPNLTVIARKLRAQGVAPETDVVVIGKGDKGNGEEGRIAWMLRYMGVQKIKIMTFEDYKGRKNSYDRKDNWAPPVWLPKVDEKMRIKFSELEKNPQAVLIDTRSKEEFEQGHIAGAICIFWQKFVGADIKKLLLENKIDLKSELVFYDSSGVGAAYATFVTADAGIPARFYDGGYGEWQKNKNK